MNLTVLCPHFAPDVAPTGEVMTSIVTELAARGHRLHVVTALPWYLAHRVEPGWEGRVVRTEATPWGRVSRCHPFPTDKTNVPARALAFGGFSVVTGAVGAAGRDRVDAVLAMSPPLTLGLTGWAVAQARRAPFVFNVQDVFPDVAVELGVLKGERVIRAARWLERTTYRRADAVTVLSEDLRDNVAGKLPAGERAKVRVIPNFVDTERIRPGERENGYRREHGLEGRTVVMYAGNVGMSQSLDLLVDAAAAMADDPSVVFVVNGSGSGLDAVRRRADGLANVRFVGLQPKERLPEVLAAADVHLVLLKRGLGRSSVPSKLYSVLAAGRPVVASIDPGTEVTRVLAAAGAGVAVAPDDPGSFTAAVARLVQAPQEAAAMGLAGRTWVERWLSPAAVAAAYEELFAELVARRRGRAGRPARRG